MKKLYVFRFYEEKQFLLEEIEGEGVAGAHPVPPFLHGPVSLTTMFL